MYYILTVALTIDLHTSDIKNTRYKYSMYMHYSNKYIHILLVFTATHVQTMQIHLQALFKLILYT